MGKVRGRKREGASATGMHQDPNPIPSSLLSLDWHLQSCWCRSKETEWGSKVLHQVREQKEEASGHRDIWTYV